MPVAAYFVAFGSMLFAGLVAVTVFYVTNHLDYPVHESAEPIQERKSA